MDQAYEMAMLNKERSCITCSAKMPAGSQALKVPNGGFMHTDPPNECTGQLFTPRYPHQSGRVENPDFTLGDSGDDDPMRNKGTLPWYLMH